jgi:hypothetical protein
MYQPLPARHKKMNKRGIILKAEDYKYPNSEERKKAESKFPGVDFFDFRYKHEIEAIHNDGLSMNEASRQGNLWNWNICLRNHIAYL